MFVAVFLDFLISPRLVFESFLYGNALRFKKRCMFMATDAILRVTLAIIIGTLAAIVYSLRVLVLMERRVARMERHIESIALRIVEEEYRIESGLGARAAKKGSKGKKRR